MSKRKRKKKKTQKTQGLGRVVEPIHNLSKAFGSVSSVREEKEIGNVLGVRTKEEKNQNNNKQKKNQNNFPDTSFTWKFALSSLLEKKK